MGLFERIRKKEDQQKQVDHYFQLMKAYTPAYTTFEGSVYEMELTRAVIHTFATHCSKLKPEVSGADNEQLERTLQYRPNPWMNTSQYLYKLATLYMTENTAFIAPIVDTRFDANKHLVRNVVGYVPLRAKQCQVKQNGKDKILVFRNGSDELIYDLDEIGILTQYNYRSDLFGNSNDVLRPTMELLNATNQGIIEGVKNSANVRFLAKLAMTLAPKDMEDERKRLVSGNLSAENNGGVLIYDQKYEDIQQIKHEQYTINADQMKTIKENVLYWAGCSEHILTNAFNSQEWAAYYEGKIEPFAIQASLSHTNMTFNREGSRALSYGNEIIFTANRLQYLSPTEKLNTVTELFDRGFLTHNQGYEIYNMDGIGEEGDKRYIRLEYAEVGANGTPIVDHTEIDEEGDNNASEE